MSQELIEKFKSLLGSMSYYNAAESTWREEREKREACQKSLKDLAKNLRYQGIDPKPIAAGYLVSESDYTER